MNLPSKELLSEVLGINKNLIQMPPIFEASVNSIGYLYGSVHEVKNEYDVKRQHKRVNVHELAHKCKEWANQKGYVLSSAIAEQWCVCEYYTHKGYDAEEYISYTTADTEPEAIFKACEWILENKEIK